MTWRLPTLGVRRNVQEGRKHGTWSELAPLTWDESAYRWLQETQHKKSHHYDVLRFKWLQPYLSMKPLEEITRDVVMEIAEIKRKQTSPSNANRVIANIRAVLRRAEREWEWIERSPALRMYPEPKRRIRWLRPEQAHTLLGAATGASTGDGDILFGNRLETGERVEAGVVEVDLCPNPNPAQSGFLLQKRRRRCTDLAQ